MLFPTKAKCKKLSQQLEDARELLRKQEMTSNQIIGEQKRQLSILEFKSKLPSIALADMTDKAKRRLSQYQITTFKNKERCINCNEVEARINRSDTKIYFCGKHQHRVNSGKGTCPSFKVVEMQVAG